MVRISILLCTVFCLSFGLTHAQDSIECQTKLSNFHEDVKAQRYDKAYDNWYFVKTNCPELSLAIYSDGEKILKHKIDNSEGETQIGFVNDLLGLWKDRRQYFESRTPIGEFGASACQLRYDYREELGEGLSDLYNCFDDAFKSDKENFTHPKSLYAYFSLLVEMYRKDQKQATELFNTYDEIEEKIGLEIQNYSELLNALVHKIDNGETLSSKEIKKRSAYESYLKNYALINSNIETIINTEGNCENLIPLYTKDFESHKNDSIWLKRAVSRLYLKDCSSADFYEMIVKQYDTVSPSADTKVFIATMLFAKGKDKEAFQYLEEAYQLETRPYKKSNLAIRIGVIYKQKNRYSTARNYLMDALKLNPSNGKPHLVIAQMYSDSAKDTSCGKDNFHQRAVYWLAAEEAKKASRIDPTLQKYVRQSQDNYLAMAPGKDKIFLSGLGGETIQIKCWINRSIVVPKP